MIATLLGSTAVNQSGSVSKSGSPQSIASAMPWMLPVSLVMGVLKSPWASSQRTKRGLPISRQWRATPATEPIEIEWSPPRKIGRAPDLRLS